MGRRCAIRNCVNNRSKPVSTIYSFPSKTSSNKRIVWESFVEDVNGQSFEGNLEYFGLCALHFADADILQNPSPKRQRLCPDAIPVNHTGDLSQSTKELVELRAQKFIFEKGAQKSEAEFEKKIKELEDALHRKNEEVASLKEQITTILSPFTNTQQQMLKNPSRKYPHWKDEDIAKSVELYSISPKAYQHVRQEWKLPLPSDRTIRKYLQNLVIEPEKPIESVFKSLKAQYAQFPSSNMHCQCILALDEVSIDPRYCYDFSLDAVYGGEKNITMFCARGLFSDWKQPLMYSFDQTTEQVLQLIKQLHEVGVAVVGLVSDMGPKNMKIWRDLQVGKVLRKKIKTTSFNHPITGRKIYIFPDFPHLLKRLRDQVLDSSLTLPDGTMLERKWFKSLIKIQKDNELKLTPKLSLKHLYARGQDRQNVKTAFNLFSHTTATAVRVVLRDWTGKEEVADFIERINNLADLSNTRFVNNSNNVFISPYGKHLWEQAHFLKTTKEYLMKCFVGKRRKSFCPFQKGLIIYIQSFLSLFQDMTRRNPVIQYVLTSHLNQDYVENLFSQVRGVHGLNSNPNAVEFKYRLRKILLKWNSSNPNIKRILCAKERTVCEESDTLDNPMEEHVEEFHVTCDTTMDIATLPIESIVNEGGKEYIAAYMASKFRQDHPEMNKDSILEESRGFWIAALSKGGLTEPSDVWFAVFLKLEELFQTKFCEPKSICKKHAIMQSLYQFLELQCPGVSEDILKYFAKIRIMIRIKFLNKTLENAKFSGEEARCDMLEEALQS